MKRYIFMPLFLAALLLGFTAVGMAEPEEDFDRPPTKEQKDKVRERIETLRMWKLTKALDLDEKTSSQLFPILNKYDKKRFEIESALRKYMKELRDAVRDGRKDTLKGILDRLEQNHKTLQAIADDERAELKKLLAVEQQAKFVLFKVEFERELRKVIEEARGRRAEKFGKDMPAGPLPPEPER